MVLIFQMIPSIDSVYDIFFDENKCIDFLKRERVIFIPIICSECQERMTYQGYLHVAQIVHAVNL